MPQARNGSSQIDAESSGGGVMPNLLPLLIVSAIWCGSFVCGALPFVFLNGYGTGATIAAVACFPVLFVVSFALIAGSVSRVGQKGIVRGKFPREAMHPVYLMRRIYGAAWTQLYYFKPVYAVVLAIPVLKKAVFRLYGYKGSTDFIAYPDTWIRDLPVLSIGKGAYLSNRATVGTNLFLSSGEILVDKISFADKSLLGHLAKCAPGLCVEQSVEIGVDCTIGIRVHLGESTNVKPVAAVNHGSFIGPRCEIGTRSFIGLKVKLGEGIIVPAAAHIPDGAIYMTQADFDVHQNTETKLLEQQRDVIMDIVRKQLEHAQAV